VAHNLAPVAEDTKGGISSVESSLDAHAVSSLIMGELLSRLFAVSSFAPPSVMSQSWLHRGLMAEASLRPEGAERSSGLVML